MKCTQEAGIRQSVWRLGYGVDGPGTNLFSKMSTPTLWPIQPPIQCVPGFLPGR